MQFLAKALYVRFSQYKLRPLADVVRGKNVAWALGFLATRSLKKAMPLYKTVKSAAANAKDMHNIECDQLMIKEIRVDQGPMYQYFKPGAMGRANLYKKRSSHIKVVVQPLAEAKEV